MKLEQALQTQPKVLALEVTTRCNLDCVYCTKKSKQIGDVDIVPELVERVKGGLAEFEKLIICGIGESFCYPGIYELIPALTGQKITIVTNGTVPIDYARLNASGNVEMLIFSIDALDQQILDQISGRYSLGNLLKNLEAYDQYKKASKRRIQRVLNCTLNEHNLSEIMKLVDFAREHHFETIHFSFPRGQEAFIAANQVELTELLRKAGKQALSYGIYFANPFDTCCVYLKWVTPYLSINGDVFACAETLYIDQKLGNIKEMSFGEIWASEAYREFQTGAACRDCKFLSNCQFKF